MTVYDREHHCKLMQKRNIKLLTQPLTSSHGLQHQRLPTSSVVYSEKNKKQEIKIITRKCGQSQTSTKQAHDEDEEFVVVTKVNKPIVIMKLCQHFTRLII